MSKFKPGDIVAINPEAVDIYFKLAKPKGKVIRVLLDGGYKVEVYDTYSQDTEGHNCIFKFKEKDLILLLTE